MLLHQCSLVASMGLSGVSPEDEQNREATCSREGNSDFIRPRGYPDNLMPTLSEITARAPSPKAQSSSTSTSCSKDSGIR